MQVEDQRSRILWSSNRARGNQDRRRKGGESVRLANSKRGQWYAEMFGTSQLLSVVSQIFHIYSQTIIWPSKGRSELELDREAREGV